eukprot:UN01880
MLIAASLLAYILCFTGFTQEVTEIPVTYGLPEEAFATTDPSKALYNYASLCSEGVNNKKQAVLQLFLPANPDWNCTAKPIVVAQVSICDNDFSSKCVIATNYKWGTQIKAISNVSWTMNNETNYFIRTMAWNQPATFSMELSFTNNANEMPYPWTTDMPFMVPSMTIQPVAFTQYWRSDTEYVVSDEGHKHFSLAYCNQGHAINGINVVLTAPSDITDYSLLQQWACPQTVPIAECTNSNSTSNGWHNFRISSFNLMECDNKPDRTTANGIFIVVQGDGANLNGLNEFFLYASQFET